MSTRFKDDKTDPEFLRVIVLAKPGHRIDAGTARICWLLDYHGDITSIGGTHWIAFGPQSSSKALAFAKRIRNLKDADDFLGNVQCVFTIPFKFTDPDDPSDFNERELNKVEQQYRISCGQSAHPDWDDRVRRLRERQGR